MQEPITAEEVRERSRIVQQRLRQQRVVPPKPAQPVISIPEPIDEPKPEPDEPEPKLEPLSVSLEHPITRIQTIIARRFELSKQMLMSNRRIAAISRPRQFGMFIARQLLRHGFPEIGRRFGKDHATATHAHHKTLQRVGRDPMLAAHIEDIAREIAADLNLEWSSASFWEAVDTNPIRVKAAVERKQNLGMGEGQQRCD